MFQFSDRCPTCRLPVDAGERDRALRAYPHPPASWSICSECLQFYFGGECPALPRRPATERRFYSRPPQESHGLAITLDRASDRLQIVAWDADLVKVQIGSWSWREFCELMELRPEDIPKLYPRWGRRK